MYTVVCPYCDNVNSINDLEDIGDEFDMECKRCEKTFNVEVSYLPYFESSKADCKNGGEHKFRDMIGFPDCYYQGKLQCTTCGLEKDTLTQEERQKLIDEDKILIKKLTHDLAS